MATLANIDNNTWGISTMGYGVIVEGIAVIRQRIDLVLRTSRRSDPLRPLFGSNIYKYIDEPLFSAIPKIKAEIVFALEMWMPEIEVTAITHTLKSPENPVFEITYRIIDDTLVDKLLFDIKQGQTTSSASNEIILQAFFPANPNNYRYQIKLLRNDADAYPTPPTGGFATIQDMFSWVQGNWFIWGRWFLLNDRIVCYMSTEGITSASLAISVLAVTQLSAVFPLVDTGQFYKVIFTVNGSPASPAMPQTFSTAGEVLFWAQNNWGSYGTWSIEGSPANSATSFTDEFSLEFDSPEPDTFKLILVSTIQGFTGDLQIIVV